MPSMEEAIMTMQLHAHHTTASAVMEIAAPKSPGILLVKIPMEIPRKKPSPSIGINIKAHRLKTCVDILL